MLLGTSLIGLGVLTQLEPSAWVGAIVTLVRVVSRPGPPTVWNETYRGAVSVGTGRSSEGAPLRWWTTGTRTVMGLALLMPVTLPGINVLMLGGGLQPTLSDYYYTGTRPVFLILMQAVSVILLVQPLDWPVCALSRVAGLGALGVAAFPTPPQGAPIEPVNAAHIVAVAVLATSLAVMTFCYGPNSRSGSVLHRAVGAIILLCAAGAGVDLLMGLTPEGSLLPFGLESAAMGAYGVFWLITHVRAAPVPPRTASA